MLRRSMTDRRRRAWTPSLGRSSFFFFRFSASSSNNLRFAFLALKVASQGFTWKILICSSKIDHVLRCSLSGELATGRARLRTAVRGAALQLQLQLTEPKEQCVAQRGLCAQAWSLSWKVRLGPQSYSIWLFLHCIISCPKFHLNFTFEEQKISFYPANTIDHDSALVNRVSRKDALFLLFAPMSGHHSARLSSFGSILRVSRAQLVGLVTMEQRWVCGSSPALMSTSPHGQIKKMAGIAGNELVSCDWRFSFERKKTAIFPMHPIFKYWGVCKRWAQASAGIAGTIDRGN